MTKTIKSKAPTPTRHVMAFDPGPKHFAYCDVVGSIIKSVGTLTETINDLKSGIFPYRMRVFYRQIKKLIETSTAKHGKITDMVIERYMARPGKGGGGVSEHINIMIGVVALYCYRNDIHVELISASLWKNKFRRQFGMDTQAARYGFTWVAKDALKTNPYPLSDHNFDAAGIAEYYVETAPDIGAGTRTKQNRDFFKEFKTQLRNIWDAKAKEIGYDESKDHDREEKARLRAATKTEAANKEGTSKRGRKKASKKKRA